MRPHNFLSRLLALINRSRVRSDARLTSAFKNVGWGLGDQMLSSLTNFMLGLFVARAVSPSEFGAFGLAYATYTLALGAARAVSLEALVVRFSAVKIEQWRGAVAGAAGTSLILGATVGSLTVFASVFAEGSLRTSLVLLGLAIPALLLQDVWRFAFFSLGRPAGAFWNDFVWATALFGGTGAVYLSGGASLATLMIVWVCAGCTAALVGLVQTGIMPAPTRTLLWIGSIRELGIRFFAEFLVSNGASQLSLFLIGAIATLADVGHIRAGQMILGPLNILFMSAGLVAVAEAAKMLAESLRKMDHAIYLVTSLLTLCTTAWAIVALLLPDPIGVALMGSNWDGGQTVLLPLAIGSIGVALSYGPITGLRALADARSSLRARMVDAAASLFLSATGAFIAGSVGAAWGFALAGCLRVPNWWWHFRGARRSYSTQLRIPTPPTGISIAPTLPEGGT